MLLAEALGSDTYRLRVRQFLHGWLAGKVGKRWSDLGEVTLLLCWAGCWQALGAHPPAVSLQHLT